MQLIMHIYTIHFSSEVIGTQNFLHSVQLMEHTLLENTLRIQLQGGYSKWHPLDLVSLNKCGLDMTLRIFAWKLATGFGLAPSARFIISYSLQKIACVLL